MQKEEDEEIVNRMTAQMSALLKMDMLKAGQGFRQENYRKGKSEKCSKQMCKCLSKNKQNAEIYYTLVSDTLLVQETEDIN